MITPLNKIPSANQLLSFYSDDIPYVHTVWLTAHNAFSSVDEKWNVYYQQNLNLKDQFSYGVRSFMIDIYYYNDDLYLCHGGCKKRHRLIQRGNFSEPELLLMYLKELRTLLDKNPSEIITLHLEDHSGDSSKVMKVFQEAGLHDFLLTSNPNDLTLTLGKMRASGTRLVVFSDYQAERNKDDFNPRDGIFPTKFYKETVYGRINFTECEERTNDYRAKYNDPKIKLFVFNYFYWWSKPIKAFSINDYCEINGYTSIRESINGCLSRGLFPNFVAVDFVEIGDYGGAKAIVYELLSQSMGRDVCYARE